MKYKEPVKNISILAQEAEDHKACVLHCQVSRGSELRFVWHAAGCELTSDKLHNITNEGSSLTVSMSAVQSIIYSVYRCTVSNPVSEQSIEVNLRRDCSTGT
ncbi:uncharacterized protein LOC144605562 [Rhinoraja longicauda]